MLKNPGNLPFSTDLPMGQPGVQCEGGGEGEHLGATLAVVQGKFREAEIVANGQAETANWSVHGGNQLNI